MGGEQDRDCHDTGCLSRQRRVTRGDSTSVHLLTRSCAIVCVMKVATPGRSRPVRQRWTGLSRFTLPEPRSADGGFPYRMKLLVRERAGLGDAELARCEACGRLLGRYGGQVQPRAVRGGGDRQDPVASGIANAVLLCGTSFELCLGACVACDREMETRGFWIRDGNGPGNDPRSVPVVIPGPSGRGVLVWLTDSGAYSCEPPKRA